MNEKIRRIQPKLKVVAACCIVIVMYIFDAILTIALPFIEIHEYDGPDDRKITFSLQYYKFFGVNPNLPV